MNWLVMKVWEFLTKDREWRSMIVLLFAIYIVSDLFLQHVRKAHFRNGDKYIIRLYVPKEGEAMGFTSYEKTIPQVYYGTLEMEEP